MKAALAILAILALGGAAWYYQQQTRTLAETVAQQQTELSAKTREIDKLEKELAKAKAAPKEQPAPAPAPTVATRPAPGTAPAPATPAPQPTQPGPDQVAARIAQIEADYLKTKAAHDARQAEIDAARTRAQAYIAQVEAAAPQFSEQAPRFDGAGNQIGNKGVRTSQKDREKAMQLHAQQLAAAQAGMAKVDEEQNKLNAARDAAYQAMNRALDEARAK